MKICPFNCVKSDFYSWDKTLENYDKISLIKSVITGEVELNMHGTINKDYEYIQDVPNIIFKVPVLSHIFHHEIFGNFLIDAGLDKSYSTNEYGLCKGTLLKKYGSKFNQEKNQTISNFIEFNNLNIDGIFLTHTHVDHVSGIVDLDDSVPIYFSNREKSMDIKPFYYANYFKNKKIIKIFDLSKFVNLPILGKCLDIFGDKSFYAIFTPGHTPGHLSYFLNGKEKIIFAGDACFTRHGIKYKTASSDYTWNIYQAQKSIEKLLNFSKLYNIKIIPGHSL